MVFKLKGIGVREPLLFKQRGEVIENESIQLIREFRKKTEGV